MATDRPRPLSPHLGIWRWGPGMLISILHRVTGAAVAIAGLAILTWWLMSIAAGADAYADFNAAYPAESAATRPEYADHQNVLDEFRGRSTAR